ncbi:MAG: single-stranded DNA-binding protein [Oscillospiraceae bacterium]|nr:single-stranded DNA-binding protein [Oscillospiraceae bacterium]
MLNHIVIMGRLTRDPELRRTQSGTAVASFTLAVDRDFQSRDGGEKQTDFIDCVAWRQTGEFVSKYFQKGSMAVVSGRLQLRDWQDRDGNKRRSAEVVADNVYFGESKRSGGDNGSYNRDNGGYGGNTQSYNAQPSGGYQGYQSPVRGSDFEELSDDDGDLPF